MINITQPAKQKFLIFLATLVFSLPALTALQDEKQWQNLHQQTMDLYDNGQYEMAFEQAKISLDYAQSNFGKTHIHTARSLNTLGFLYHLFGDFQSAEPLYQTALEIRIANLGQHHLDTARTQTNLALLYHDQNRYEHAELLYTNVLQTLENHFGSVHADIAVILANLSLLYEQTKREDLAQKLHNRAREIRLLEKQKKQNHGKN